MPTNIKLKNSVTTTAAPSTLVQGEVAVNIIDKKIWVGDASSGVVQILGAGATVSGTDVNYTGTLTGGTGVVNLGSGQFYKDASGNVGIGTSSPYAKTDIFQSTVGYGGWKYCLNLSGTDYPALRLLATTGNTGNLIGHDAGSLLFASGTTATAAGTERMRIDSSGNVGIGTSSANASAILDVQSTTKGVRMPNMTTTQKNAISSPAAGLMVFDTTLAKLCVYSGSAWQTITSV